MKCSGENVILRGICHVVSCFPLHFMSYHGNLDYFSDSVCRTTKDDVWPPIRPIACTSTQYLYVQRTCKGPQPTPIINLLYCSSFLKTANRGGGQSFLQTTRNSKGKIIK